MSRSRYVDDCEHLELYRANVRRTIHSKRGQAFLRELAASMDAMPEKVLIAEQLIDDAGYVCAIGVVCKARGLDVSKVDYEDAESVGNTVGISRIMAAEIEYENDEAGPWQVDESPEQRWERMRKWVDRNLEAPLATT